MASCGICKRKKLVFGYVDSLGQRTRLKLGPVDKKLQILLTETFKEPYPEGNRNSLTACPTCDDTFQWPRNKPKTSRFSL